MQSDAGARRDANLVVRHDAEHQRAGGIADAVDDDALALRADALILGFVFLDVTAMVARDTQRGTRRSYTCGKDRQNQKQETAHQGNALPRRGNATANDDTTLAGVSMHSVKHAEHRQNPQGHEKSGEICAPAIPEPEACLMKRIQSPRYL